MLVDFGYCILCNQTAFFCPLRSLERDMQRITFSKGFSALLHRSFKGLVPDSDVQRPRTIRDTPLIARIE